MSIDLQHLCRISSVSCKIVGVFKGTMGKNQVSGRGTTFVTRRRLTVSNKNRQKLYLFRMSYMCKHGPKKVCRITNTSS